MLPVLSLEAVQTHVGSFSEALTHIQNLAETLHTPVFLVGGCVRDMLLNRPVHDLDCLVLHPVEAFVSLLVEQHGGEFFSNPAFKTARWITQDQHTLDFANPRKEFYPAPAALPHISAHHAQLDMERRDFSINAMALAVHRQDMGALHDPFHGALDLKTGELKILHTDSFRDDPTRIFRAARFCARLSMVLEQQTHLALQACLKNHHLEHLSAQRTGAELQLLWKETHKAHAYALLHAWGVLDHLKWPEINHEEVVQDLAKIPAQKRFHTALAWLALAKHCPFSQRHFFIPYLHKEHGLSASLFCHTPETTLTLLNTLGRCATPEEAGMALLHTHPIAVACAQLWVVEKHAETWLVWWEEEGQHVRTTVDGNTLIQQGFKPSSHFKTALLEAQKAAFAKASPHEQLQAALHVLHTSAK
jgi:tRNA nucleotidyltransferase/poly(A) polymerase